MISMYNPYILKCVQNSSTMKLVVPNQNKLQLHKHLPNYQQNLLRPKKHQLQQLKQKKPLYYNEYATRLNFLHVV